MRGRTRFQWGVLGASTIGAITLLGGALPASAASTPAQTATVDLGDLDISGSGAFEAFDPTLGTLTRVDINVETTMQFDVCIHNRSTAADSVPSGEATGTAPITFPADVVSNAHGAMSVPPTDLTASDGTDDCTAWLDGGAEPASGDSRLITETDVSTFAANVTDPGDLAAYVGPGTIPYDYQATSASSIGQPSEWTIIFLAEGSANLSIVYTYEPAGTTTTTTQPGTTPPCETTMTTTPPDDTNTTAPPCDTTTTTTATPSLPETGSSTGPTLMAAGLLVAAGAGLIYVTRLRRT